MSDEEKVRNPCSEVESDPVSCLPKEVFLYWIFPCLALSDLCTLRGVSLTWKQWIEEYFYQLKELDVTPYQHILSADGFTPIVKHFHNLIELNMNNCWISGSESNFLEIGKRCQGLVSFTAEHCKEVTDVVLSNFAKNCKKLKYLEISYCFNVTDAGIISIAESCPNLRVLYVASNYGVSDKSISVVAEKCKCLEQLDVSRCFHVTDVGLREFLEGNTKKGNIKYIRVTDCNKMTAVAMLSLVKLGVTVNNCF